MIWLFAPCLVAPCLVAPYSPYNVSADRPCALPASFARLPFAPFELPVRPASLIRLASAAAVALRLASVALRFLLLFEPPAEALLLAPPELDRGELPRFPSSWEYWSEAHRCRSRTRARPPRFRLPKDMSPRKAARLSLLSTKRTRKWQQSFPHHALSGSLHPSNSVERNGRVNAGPPRHGNLSFRRQSADRNCNKSRCFA